MQFHVQGRINVIWQAAASDFAPLPSSGVPGIVWPAIPKGRDTETFAILAQLEMSQWWSPEALQRQQFRQLSELVRFAARSVPFYRRRLAQFGKQARNLTSADWRNIPLLNRADIQDAGTELTPNRSLQPHGETHIVKTSGSTGEPVKVRCNAVTSQFHAALTLRDHIWQQRDFSRKVAMVRRLSTELVSGLETGKVARWAAAYSSGPMIFRDVRELIDDTLRWLVREEPGYLMTYPTYLGELISRANDLGLKPERLREVTTFGEPVTDDLRALCRDRWAATVVDTYSAQEVGIVALQCPGRDHYHVQSEGVLLEVLDDAGRPCEPGEIGRVVLTPLHNFATPLIRYVIGDYAEVGAPCECGRGLPVIRKFLGRAMNMLKLPSGGHVWVAVSDSGLEKIVPLRHFQIVQLPNFSLRLKLVVERALSEDEELLARHAMTRATGHEFDVQLDYVDAIPRATSGKLEVVISEAID